MVGIRGLDIVMTTNTRGYSHDHSMDTSTRVDTNTIMDTSTDTFTPTSMNTSSVVYVQSGASWTRIVLVFCKVSDSSSNVILLWIGRDGLVRHGWATFIVPKGCGWVGGGVGYLGTIRPIGGSIKSL